MITVWQKGGEIVLHQLSDAPEDGIPLDQIAHLGNLDAFAGYTCVSDDYTGTIPETDSSLWRWDGRGIVAAVPVPQEVSPRQVRLLLRRQGLLEQVNAMIATQDEDTQIEWQYAETFKRQNPLLLRLAANLGLSEQQIDEFFIAAAQI